MSTSRSIIFLHGQPTEVDTVAANEIISLREQVKELINTVTTVIKLLEPLVDSNIRSLSERDSKIFLEMLQNPPEPNEALRQAVQRASKPLKQTEPLPEEFTNAKAVIELYDAVCYSCYHCSLYKVLDCDGTKSSCVACVWELPSPDNDRTLSRYFYRKNHFDALTAAKVWIDANIVNGTPTKEAIAAFPSSSSGYVHQKDRASIAALITERDRYRQALEEIELRTRSNGDMADAAVNNVANRALNK